MGNSAATETPEVKRAREEKELAEQRRLAEQQARDASKPGEQSFGDLVLAFIKWLFGPFFKSENAPDELPVAPSVQQPPVSPPETTADLVRMGRLLIESRAIPKWHEYRETHKNVPVNFTSPLEGNAEVNSGYGMRFHPIHKKDLMHDGVDMVAPNRKVLASAGGIVLFSGNKKGYGQTVIIGHADGRSTLYGHLTGAAMPSVGNEVAQRQQVGVLGATGDVTGPHLHYEQRRGEKSMQPVVNGVPLTKGMQVAGAGSTSDHTYAALVDRTTHPKLPTGQPQSPQALAFAPGAKVQGGAAVRGG